MKRKLAPIILSVITAICCATELTACIATNTPSNNVDPADPDATITNPSDGDATDPTEPNTTEQHSQIFYDVLNSSYYNNLYEENKTFAGSILAENACAPIPFSFLEQNNHNIDKIKSGDLECASQPYIKGDDTTNLYIPVRVETKASPSYYTCYVLKYSLTSVEYNDLYNLTAKSIIQASFYIQELSYQKTATVISSANISKTAYNGIINRVLEVLPKDTEMDFMGYSIEDNTLQCIFRPTPNAFPKSTVGGVQKNVEIRYAILEPSLYNYYISKEFYGLQGPVYNDTYYVSFTDYLDFCNNPEIVSYFDIQGRDMAPYSYNTTNTK